MTRAILLAVLLAACTTPDDTGSDAPATYTLTFTGTGYTPGWLWEAFVVDGAGAVVDGQMGGLSGDTLRLTFADRAEHGQAYALHLYFDADSSGSCGPDDPQWAHDYGVVTADSHLEVSYDTDYTAVCATFGD